MPSQKQSGRANEQDRGRDQVEHGKLDSGRNGCRRADEPTISVFFTDQWAVEAPEPADHHDNERKIRASMPWPSAACAGTTTAAHPAMKQPMARLAVTRLT